MGRVRETRGKRGVAERMVGGERDAIASAAFGLLLRLVRALEARSGTRLP